MTASFSRPELLGLYEHGGTPIATVYVPSQSDVEDAEQQLSIRKDNLVRAIGEAGGSTALQNLVETELGNVDHADGVAHLILATENEILMSAPLSRPLTRARAWVEPVPMLVPLLGATQVDEDHLAVLLDRSGADVTVRSGVGQPLDEFEVDGPYERLQRSAPGGWSQKRFQQTAENAWELNAREVIDEIVQEHPDVGLFVYGGDVRARGFFAQHLPERIEAIEADGSRHADHDAFLDAADIKLRDRAAEATVDLLDSFRTGFANGNGAKGRAVLDMLVQGRVSDLLVVDRSLSESWPVVEFDFANNTVAETTPGGNAVTAPLIETAVARAVATGAAVHVVPNTADLEDGLAAILRF